MNRLVLVFACFLILLETATSQTAQKTQTVREKVSPAVSEKLLCGSVPARKSVTSGASAQTQSNTFCGPLQAPIYPASAKDQGIQGAVLLGVVVGTDGTVKDVRVIEGHPLLAPAAVDAVSKWTYRPYYVNHKPTEIETTVVVNFQLQRK